MLGFRQHVNHLAAQHPIDTNVQHRVAPTVGTGSVVKKRRTWAGKLGVKKPNAGHPYGAVPKRF